MPNEQTEPLFGYHLIRMLRPEMMRLASGTTFLEISKADFARIRTRRPARSEQLRIAMVLEAMDGARTATHAVMGKLSKIRSGLIRDLLARGIDENGRLRDLAQNSEHIADVRRSRSDDATYIQPAACNRGLGDAIWFDVWHLDSHPIPIAEGERKCTEDTTQQIVGGD